MNSTEPEFPRSFLTTAWIPILVFSLWACVYIWNTSFVLDGQRYFCLFDDAMVSMRYAHNLANGEGLVWNPGGERVEGFTNLLWVLIMTLVHLTGVPVGWTSLVIQLFGLMLLAGSLACIFRMTQLVTGSTVSAWGSFFLTGFYLPLATWSLQGMEVSLQVFLLYYSVLLLIKAALSETPVPILFYVLLGCGVLVRMDMVLPCAFLLLGALIYLPHSRKSVLVLGGSSLLVVLAGLTLFRWWYYGDVFPNTFYLKSCGIPFSTKFIRGLSVTQDFIETMGWFLFTVPLVFLVYSVCSPALALPGLLFPFQLAYSISVGGDAWEWWGHYGNRYVCVGMPAFFLLLTAAVHRLFRSLPGSPDGGRGKLILSRTCIIGILLISWLAVHGATTREGLKTFLQQMTFRELPLHVADNAANVATAVWLKKATPPDTAVAVHWAGALPYFCERPCIDLLGKNDRVVAHLPSRINNPHAWIPGHDRWDYTYSLGRLKPAVIVSTTPPQAFEEYGYQTVDTVKGFFILVSRMKPEILKGLDTSSPRASDFFRTFASQPGNREKIKGYLPEVNERSLKRDLNPYLLPGEVLLDTTILVKDVYVFTNQRLLLVDRQKLAEIDRHIISIPYADILDFEIDDTNREDFKARLKVIFAGGKQPWVKEIRRRETAEEIFQKLNRFIQKQG